LSERISLAIKFGVSHLLLLPLLLSIAAMMPQGIVLLPVAQTILLILFFAGYWEFVGSRVKWLYFMTLEVLLILLGVKSLSSGEMARLELPWIIGFVALELYLCFLFAKILVVIFKSGKEKIEIEFPFRNGNYLITDGGNSRTSRMMNYHFHSVVHKRKKTNSSMLYATDVIKVDSKHPRFMPPRNDDYPIFGDTVYSPMSGEVVRVVNDINDNIPFSGSYPYNTGNTVVIKHNNYYFLLGHLKKNSLLVKEGDLVSRGQVIAKAGNSGMSERPHLHMQLMKAEKGDYWKGMGICIQFKGKNLYKNRLVKV